MKRLIAIMVLAVMVLTGCGGGGIPEGMDQKTYDLGKDALKVMQEYRDDKMDPEEAHDRLDQIYNDLAALKLKDEADTQNVSVMTDITSASVQILDEKSVIDEIDSLKKTLGME